MKVRWRRRWIAAPCYAPSPGGVIVAARSCAGVARIADKSGGRIMIAPARKVRVFLVLEGPARTWSKVRAKVEQRHYLGHWHVTLVYGRCRGDGRWVLALAPCAPAAASHFLVPGTLVRPLAGPLGSQAFAEAADRLREQAATLERHGHERYLYSGNPVPEELVDALEGALAGVRVAVTDGAGIREARPAPASGEESTMQQVGRVRPRPRGTPLALLGAGDYARIETLAALSRCASLAPLVLADREPHIAIGAARRSGFRIATTDPYEAVDALPAGGAVIVATAHDSHASLAAYASRAGHSVFVEKPAIVTAEDLTTLVSAWHEAPGRIEVGFNRRRAPLMPQVRAALREGEGPLTISCIVRELPMRDTHWFLWPNQGTRVAGNLCHWLDLGVHLVGTGVDPVEVRISPPLASDRSIPSAEERSISVAFADGSLLTILGTVRGDATRGVQEWIDVRRDGLTLTIDDFRTLTVLEAGRRRVRRRLVRDKGHTAMYRDWAASLQSPAPERYPLSDLLSVCVLQLAVTDMIRSGTERRNVLEEIEAWREAPGDGLGPSLRAGAAAAPWHGR